MTAPYALDDASVVVVVGSGAGGGTLAAALAARGVPVVCLEAGGRVAIEQQPRAMFRRLVWDEPRTSEGDLNPALPVYIDKAVGGTTIHWGGVALRLQPHELRARSTYGEIDGASLADWPIGYADLEPWYERAERRLGVTGRHGLPSLPDHNNSLVLQTGARRLGYRQVSNGSMAINPVERDGRPACQQLGFCAFGCVIGAKWSTLHAEIPRAEATGSFELRPHSRALRIEHDDEGRATGVLYADAEGARQRQRARAVCLAGNGIETPRLLLLSESSRFPEGLANSSGMVGRNYMTDILGRVIAVMPGEVHNYRGTTNAGLVADEMRHDPERGFAGGYVFATRGIHLPLFPNEPEPMGWGQEYAEILEAYRNIASAAVLGEDLPQHDNRVTLDREVEDDFGLPVAHVRKVYHPNDKALYAHSVRQGTALYESLGARRVFTRQGLSAIHNLGTCRQSEEPERGVCDVFGRTHDVPNLFISDGSQFVTSGAAPPTLTIVALALRQAEHIAEQLRTAAL